MAKIPSIALIPSGYKATKIYSVLPVDGSADLTFSRAGEATRVNKDELIEDVANNVPRLDYSDSGCPALLLEPQSTNLSLYSENFTLWSGASVTADQAISPDGNLTAYELTKTGSFDAISRTETGTSGVNYVLSLFVKPKTTNRVTLRQASGSNDVRRYFDLSNETSGQSGGNNIGFISEGIEKYPNGWYRIHTVCTSNGTAIATNLYAGMAGNTTYDGEVYIWGSQLEAGSYATSYIPTSGSQATRIAETCSKSGLENYINSSEGVLYVEIAALADDLTTRRISLSDGSTSNVVRISYEVATNRIYAVLYNGANQAALNYSSADITQFSKIAFKFKENDFALWVDGVERQTDNSGTTFTSGTLTRLGFDRGDGGSDFYGKVKDLRVYDVALTDEELQNLTTL